MHKRLISLVMSVAMLFTLVEPSTLVYATEVTNVQDSVTDSQDDDTTGSDSGSVAMIKDSDIVAVDIEDDADSTFDEGEDDEEELTSTIGEENGNVEGLTEDEDDVNKEDEENKEDEDTEENTEELTTEVETETETETETEVETETEEELTGEQLLEKAKKGEILTAEERERLVNYMLEQFPPAKNTSSKRKSAAKKSGTVSNSISSTHPQTDYLEIATNGGYIFSIGKKVNDWTQSLLYPIGAGGSHWMYQLDDDNAKPTASYYYDSSTGKYIAVEINGDVTVTTELYITKSATTGLEDVAEIVLTVTNNSDVNEHQFGAKVGLDVYIGDNTCASYYTSTQGRFDTARILEGDDIPQYWQGLDDITNPTFIGQGTFYRNISERPDIVYFTYWNTACYDYTPYVNTGAYNGDTGIAIKWNQKTLAPGETRTYTTWLGMGQMDVDNGEKVTLATTADTVGEIDESRNEYNPFTVTGIVKNVTNETLTNLTAYISLPDGLSIYDGSGRKQQISSLEPGEEAVVSWQLQGKPMETGGTRSYTIAIISEDDEELASSVKSIEFPALDVVGPTFIEGPSVLCSTDSTVAIKLPIATDSSGVAYYMVSYDGLEKEIKAYYLGDIYISEDTDESIPEYLGAALIEDIRNETRVYIRAVDNNGNVSNLVCLEVSPMSTYLFELGFTVYSDYDYDDVYSETDSIVIVDGDSYTDSYKVGGNSVISLYGRALSGAYTDYSISYRKADWYDPYEGWYGDWNELDTYEVHQAYRTYLDENYVEYSDTDFWNESNYGGETVIIGGSSSTESNMNISFEYAEEYQEEAYLETDSVSETNYSSNDYQYRANHWFLSRGYDYNSWIEQWINYDEYICDYNEYSLSDFERVLQSEGYIPPYMMEEFYYLGDYTSHYYYSLDKFDTKWDIRGLESGTYVVRYSAKDADGTEYIKTLTFEVSNDIPETIEGLNAECDIRTIDLSWYVAKEYDVTGYKVYRREALEDTEDWTDWELLVETTDGRNNISYTDNMAQKGMKYQYYVTAVSPYGIEGIPCEPVDGALARDTEPPVVSSLSPARNTVLSDIGTNIISASATDNEGVTYIELYYKLIGNDEGSLFASGDGASISAKLDTTGIPDGKIQVYALAYDEEGNVSKGSPIYTYIVDNTGPAQVTDLEYTSSATVVTLSWSYLQDNDFDHFVVEELDEETGRYHTVTTVKDTLGANITNLRPGTTHTYRVYGVDTSGNKGEASEPIETKTASDTTKPIVSAISPSAGYKNSDFTVTFTLKDDYSLESAIIQISRDRVNWTTVDTKTFDNYYATQTVSYNVDISDYEDGSLYMRAIPTDRYGNQGDSNNATASYVEYVLDTTPPAVPANVTVTAVGTSVYVKWDNDPAGETVSYTVLRSDSENGKYTEIATSLKAISYYDRTAMADATYWYKVVGYDSVGNVSEGSAPVSGGWTNYTDNEAPQILSVGPADGSTLGGSSTSISVLAEDDMILDHLDITYKRDTNVLRSLIEEEKSVTITGNGNYYLQVVVQLDLGDYSTGDTIQVSVVAYDANNNSSEVKKYKYTIDTTAPSIDNLEAIQDSDDDSIVNITWNAGDDSDDLNGYYIYRSRNGNSWTKIGARGKRDNGIYDISDTLTSSGTYTYKVEAIDLTGNKSETISEAVSYTKPVVPVTPEPDRCVAEFTTDLEQQQSVEYLFDATDSYADAGIDSYYFDFGDGTYSDKKQYIHVYDEIGTYTVTLKITDLNGNTDVSSQIIEVKERAALGNLSVTVVDDSGNRVKNAPVYFGMGTDSQVIKYTDSNGVATFTKASGSYKVGAYMDGYLPVTKQVIVSGGTDKSVELIMVEQPIVTGEFEVKRMTLDEIKAANIDLGDPANQNCVSAVIRLTYGEKVVDMNYTYNNSGIIVGGSNIAIIDDRKFVGFPIIIPSSGGGSSGNGSGGGGGSSYGDSNSVNTDIVAVMEMPVNASALKEFFDVRLYIMNQATEEFTLVDNEISLNVPEGLTVMPQSQNTIYETKSSIGGQQKWELEWILRGDEAGEYNLSADYSSVLDEFDAFVSATFETQEPIKVYGKDAIKLVADINSSIAYGGMYFDLSIENMGEADLYLPSVDVFDNLIDIFENLDNGLVEERQMKVNVRNTYITNSSGYKQYLGADGSVDVLAVGEKFTKQYYVYNAVTTTDLTYLREVLNMTADESDANIEINVVNKDLYSVVDSDEKYNSIFSNSTKTEMYNYLLEGMNFRYYWQALEDDNWVSEYLYEKYRKSKAVANLNLMDYIDTLRGDDQSERDMAREYIYEMLQDESYQNAVDTTIDKAYLEITKSLLGFVKGVIGDAGKEYYFEDTEDMVDLVNVLDSSDNARQLASILEEDGLEGFEVRLLNIIGGFATAGGLTLIRESLEANLGDEFMDIMNEGISDGFDAALDILKGVEITIDAWNTASEITQKLIQISAAESQAIALTEYILDYKENDFPNTPTYKEVEKIHQGLIDGFKSQQDEFYEQLVRGFANEVVLEDIVVPALDAIFFAGDPYLAIAMKTLKILYNAADYLLGWENTANVYIGLKVGLYLSRTLEDSTDGLSDGSDSINFLTSLKYLIKVRLVGERMFVNFINDYRGFNQDYSIDDALSAINEEDNMTFNSLDEYYLAFKEKILNYRDTLYDEIVTNQEQPAAPTISIDYINEQTWEQFDSTYEYSFNNVNWTTCGDADTATAIKITPKTTAQTLYVRVKESSEHRVGVTAIMAVPAMAKHRYATEAAHSKYKYVVKGLTPNTAYELLLADSGDTDNCDWSGKVTATTDENGELSLTINGSGSYLLYRYPATGSTFASEPHSIVVGDLTVAISATTQGNGTIKSDGEVFRNKTLDIGDILNLKVEYDSVSTSFDGWYIGTQLYSDKESLSIEAIESMDLTAVFSELPQYTMTVTADEGGNVNADSQTVYKGQKVTVNAYAAKGYTFYGWYDATGKLVSVNSARTVTMTDNMSLTAKFTKLPTARIFVSLSVQQVEGMKQPEVTVNVDDYTFNVTAQESLNETSGNILQGEEMTLTANDTQDATFVSWQNSNGQIVSTNRKFTTTTEEYNNYTAVYKVEGQSVTFTNKDGSIRSQKQYLASIDASEIEAPTGLYMSGYEFTGWKLNNDNGVSVVYGIDTEEQRIALQSAIYGRINNNEDVVLTATYQQEKVQYTVTVKGGTGGGRYTASTAITINADEPEDGKYFDGWYEGTTKLTANKSYSFYVNNDRTLEAKYADQEVDEVGITRIESTTSNKSTKKISFVSMSSVPTNCTIQKAGVIATSDSAIGTDKDNFTASTAKFVRYGTTTVHNYKYTWTKGSVSSTETWYVRAYLVYKDSNGNIHTEYGDIVAATLEGEVK